MIFLDANILLRALVDPTDAASRQLNEVAIDLMRHANRGDVEVTTSDAVLAEVAFILTGRAHYQLSASVAARLISPIIQLRGFRHPEKRAILHALEIWASVPRLGFVDALTLAYAQAPGMRLATFDTDFDGLPGIDCWQPGEAD
ncbi:MAG: type II toxin-antitoxin system VapC family toxin [Chloroflexi bacterium]|nr:type II toxin-antitoxin system VapC family toxin [Chloroflexota bacterium]